MNTYAWMKPINIENAVQTIFNAKASGPVNGDKTASCKSNPVTTSPEKILPKRRNANEATLVLLPINSSEALLVLVIRNL